MLFQETFSRNHRNKLIFLAGRKQKVIGKQPVLPGELPICRLICTRNGLLYKKI
jgi:hypothetical protein